MRLFMKVPFAALLGAALMCTSGIATANGDAYQAIRGVTLGAVDLTPSDGQAAGYTVGDWSSRLRSQFWLNGQWIQNSASVSGPDTLYGNGGGAYTTNLITTNGELHTYVKGTLAAGNRAEATVTRTASVTLAPHTMLTVSGTYDFDTYFGGPDPYHPELAGSLLLQASRFGLGEQIFSRLLLEHDSEVRDEFWFSVVNNSDSAMALDLRLETGVSMEHPAMALAVPEPATSSMLAGGLAVVGLLAARRHRAHS